MNRIYENWIVGHKYSQKIARSVYYRNGREHDIVCNYNETADSTYF